MKIASIRILDELWKKVEAETLTSADESIAFLTAKHFATKDKLIFLAENLIPARSSDYLSRSELHLKISPLYISRVLNVAESLGSTVIMLHSHPFETGKPSYSPSDDFGESRTSETISKCLDKNPPVASLLVGQNELSSRAWLGLPKKSIPANAAILGECRYRMYSYPSKEESTKQSVVDRQVGALGVDLQKAVETLEVGIVGLGGTGSSVAEQLVRMGVKKLKLVDHDTFEPSNWSRLYGSTWRDTSQKKSKVSLVGSHLKRINPKLVCNTFNKSVMSKDVLRALSSCDIIFSCVDRHAPRAVLNELAYQCFIPLIDIGVGLIKNEGRMVGGSIRASIIGPGLPCLFCQEIARPEIIAAEHLSPEEYALRRAEGYVSPVDENTPSIISYTTLASSLGLTLFLGLISGDSHESWSTLLFQLESKEMFKLTSSIKRDCVCEKRLGKGFSIPFSVAD